MPEHVSILQLTGAAVLALATVAWVVGLTRVLRRSLAEPTAWHAAHPLYGLPPQRATPPHVESVELTPAERDAFAGLVRQLSDGR
ncbi:MULTISPECIES: hypothetical protein [unclassified Streptomyces]|uniref:hypothetical protein n=1 Tax=Streptomyces TaxID=1883 RepID=UPI000A67A13E|nr:MULTISPECIES: hypothetical protein [unclassified Streptomyces]MCX4813008.1 hypothetical protein [Streptomyces sp. NBC_01239]